VSWRRKISGIVLGLMLCGCAGVAGAWAQDQGALCDGGSGHYAGRLEGIDVQVDAGKSGTFAARTCVAGLGWGGQTLVVADTGQVDIDVLGADLGLGVPVVAFQTRKADDDWRATYAIYSLRKPPQLLRTITGGDFYRARDADFDDRAAIWTRDAAAVNGLDGLTYSDFDFAPTVVLRFDHRKLMDVSSEYRAQYDEQIARVKAQLTPQALSDFRATDGKLADGSMPWPKLIALRKTKAKVLETVWAYLYSAREQEAWAVLTEDWPAADVERARSAIQNARKNGIEAQVDGVVDAGKRRHGGHVTIYNTTGTVPDSLRHDPQDLTNPVNMQTLDTIVDRAPEPIALMRENLARATESLELVIDAAGKVQSAKLLGGGSDAELLEAAKGWKFIPAYKGGHPVACRNRMNISPER
jgi:hypothetical protein